MGCGIDKNALEHTVCDVLLDDVPDRRRAERRRRKAGSRCCRAIRSSPSAEVELVQKPDREFRLRKALEPSSSQYDYVLIDCPPALNMLTVNALTATDYVLIPMQCEYFALEGLSALVGTIDKIRATSNPKLEIHGILRTMFDPRNNLANEVSAQLFTHFGERVYNTVIPRNVRLAEAPSFGRPVLFHDKYSRGALAYLALAGEVNRRSGTPLPRAADLVRPAAQSAWRRFAATIRRQSSDLKRRYMNKRKSLGRGLDALLSSARPGGAAAERRRSGHCRPSHPSPPRSRAESSLREVPVDLLRARQVPAARRHARGVAGRARRFDQGAGRRAADRRAAAAEAHGHAARPSTRSSPASAAGAPRRWPGSQTIPAVIRDIPDEAAVAVALIENIQREDLNPIEEARSLHRLIEEFGLTHADAADAVGRSRATVTNLLRLLELPRMVRELLELRQLDMGHARALLGLAVAGAADRARRSGRASRAGACARPRAPCASWRAATGAKPSKAGASAARIRTCAVSRPISRKPRAPPSSIEHGPKGGRVVIRYNGLDELEGILAHIK